MIKKRRKQGKTDYKARLALLKSEKGRVVFRKTNKCIICQYIESGEAKDKVIIGLDSKILLKYGWPEKAMGSLKSVPASYLTGFLLGKKMLDKGREKGVFDIGLTRNIKNSRAYGFLKGIIDSGIKVKASKEIFPGKEIIEGKNMKNKVEVGKIKDKINNSFK